MTMADGVMSFAMNSEFEVARQSFTALLINGSNNPDECVNHLIELFNKHVSSSSDKKATMDQVFKDVMLQSIVEKKSIETLEKLLDLSILAFNRDICTATLPVLLLNDVFDCVTIEKCEEMFAFIEKHVDTFKREAFFNSTKNSLLRMCNDLLRRLSQSQNTVFCGRILLFLAKFFPLSERSGLNVASEFNLDNVTLFGTKDDAAVAASFSQDGDDPMEEGEENSENRNVIHVDYNLYRKFWSLQDYFRNPNQCYNKISWRTFVMYADEVLKSFTSFKLDDIRLTSSSPLSQPSDQTRGQHVYFAKYLTNPKLLDLQLSDGNFRRCVLIQFLILFQYLQSVVKFKLEVYVLSEDQSQWIKTATERVYKLLKETPPNGAKFSESIEHILKREEHWSHWKNEGCPEFQQPPIEVAEKSAKAPRPKRKAGDELKVVASHNKFLLGNASLTKLWNLCPDNMEACRSQKRDFLPLLETFFEEAIEQADPVNMIEDKYKHVNNSTYGWRALRLLARRSPHFFTPSNQPISKLPLYLESMIKKVAKELPQHTTADDNKTELQEKIVVADGGDDTDDEFLKQSEEANKDDSVSAREEDVKNNLITAEQIQAIAENLSSNWKNIAPLLGCEEDEVIYYESECHDPVEQGRKMLTVWRDNFGEKATVNELITALVSTGYQELAKDIFKI